jgi:hypothetical protein
VPDDKIRRVVLCSGKVYYDLYEEREKRGIDDVYLMRVEQLYPVPLKALVHELARFKNAEVVWCQEEPRNMGAWHFIEPYLEWVLNQIHAPNRRPRYAGRAASAATATGLMSKHLAQLKAFWTGAEPAFTVVMPAACREHPIFTGPRLAWMASPAPTQEKQTMTVLRSDTRRVRDGATIGRWFKGRRCRGGG